MSKSRKIKIIISIVSISFIQGLQFSLSAVLGAISDHYPEVDVSLVQMLITVPSVLSIVAAFLCGWLVLYVSKKRMLVFAGLVAGVTGLLPLLADSFPLLFASRVAYGAASGLAMALSTAVIADFFEGDERVRAMGIQSASVGAGIMVASALGGFLGKMGYRYAYLTGIIGFVSMFFIALLLPETGTARKEGGERIRLSPTVWQMTALFALEMLFLITFNTNIGMHMAGSLAGDTAAAGILTGTFSAAQMLIGLLLGRIRKVTGKYTIPAAMLCFSLGGLLLVLFPSSFPMLFVGAAFCGFSQGIFIPTAMVEAADSVSPVSAAMASAVLTAGNSAGQLVSPFLLNHAAQLLFGEITTTNVYVIAVCGMTVTAVAVIICRAMGGRRERQAS